MDDELESLREKRKHRRMFVFCRVLDENGQAIGYALDMTREGIRMMVLRTHPDQEQFTIVMRSPDKSLADIEVTALVKKVWRSSKNEQFDEIGARFVDVKDEDSFGQFLNYFETISRKYSLDI